MVSGKDFQTKLFCTSFWRTGWTLDSMYLSRCLWICIPKYLNLSTHWRGEVRSRGVLFDLGGIWPTCPRLFWSLRICQMNQSILGLPTKIGSGPEDRGGCRRHTRNSCCLLIKKWIEKYPTMYLNRQSYLPVISIHVTHDARYLSFCHLPTRSYPIDCKHASDSSGEWLI